MGTPDDINHFRIAYRPPFRRKIYSLSNLFNAFVILIPILTYVHTYHALTIKNHWPSVAVNGPIDNVLIDEQDGSVFVTVNGDIYKYTKDLTLLSSTKSTILRATAPNNFDISQNQLINKIITIVRLKNQDVLVSCWQNRNLTLNCMLHRMNDLAYGPLTWFDRDNQTINTDSNEEMRVLFDKNDANKLLIVTNRPTASERQLLNVINTTSVENLSKSPHLPALARFKFVKPRKETTLNLLSVLPYRPRVKDYNPLYDYVAMFHYDDYTLFVLNDISRPLAPNVQDTTHYVRLARICKNDTELDSYTEISITCDNQADLYARAAHLDTTTEPTLHIIYETTKHNPSSEKSAKSYLCSYSIDLIQNIFRNVISDCHNGHESSSMLSKLHPESSLLICQRNPSTDWCTSKTNPYINGNSHLYKVVEDKFIELYGLPSINFLYKSHQSSELIDFYHIGTELGLLAKVSGREEYLYTVDLFSHSVKNYEIHGERSANVVINETITSRRRTKYALSMGHIIATTNIGEIHQVPIDSCQFYTSCRSCVTNRESPDCVWCDSVCSKRGECRLDDQSTSKCPPVVRYFQPTAGPLSGSTKLSIFGDNFGSSSKVEVKLNDQECVVDRKTTNEDRIDCYVKPVAAPANVTISVRAFDETPSSDYNTSSKQTYEYVEARTFGLYPSSGPSNGGSELIVFGANLNIGSQHKIFLGDTECVVSKLERDRMTCTTKPLHAEALDRNNSNETLVELPFRVLIDGYVLNMTKMTSYDGLNLSTTYQFQEDAKQTTEMPYEYSDHEPSSGLIINTLLLAIVIVAIFFVMFLYLKRSGGLARLEVKLPKAFEPKSTLNDTIVSFRNPQSQKFLDSNTRPGGESLNGLIKLNGSVMSSDYFGKSDQLEQDKPLMHNFLDEEMISILAQEKILVDRNKLTLGHVLGSGQFGRVYKGFLKLDETAEHAAVAVKTLHSRCHWDDGTDNRAFLEEGLMMKDFAHDNVLALIGVTFDSNGLPMVITPFMLYGDLRSYISDEASSPTVKELIEFGTQVAQGMAYLSSLKFVHRDLAARNCMLDENLTVKVADFGLSRDIYERDYYSSDNKKAKLPVKWMAIESLEKSIYNTKTDVWSFGVLLWELMTRGVVPYPDVDNFDLFSYLKEGRRMLRPRYCPVILYDIMLSCWNENPALRPTFNELVRSVSDVITKLQEAKDNNGQQKVSRDEIYCDDVFR